MKRRLSLFLAVWALPFCAFASPQKQQTLIYEKVIDGATIVASGQTISLWGVKPLDPADPVSYAADLYLKTMLGKGALSCAGVDDGRNRAVMHCYSDGADIGSLMVQMGLDRADRPYYQPEEEYAKAQNRGFWHGKSRSPL